MTHRSCVTCDRPMRRSFKGKVYTTCWYCRWPAYKAASDKRYRAARNAVKVKPVPKPDDLTPAQIEAVFQAAKIAIRRAA